MSNGKDRSHEGAHKSPSKYLQNSYESQEEDSCLQNKVEGGSSKDEWVGQEGDKEFYSNLNSIILQYLDINGLDQSYRTFYDELQTLDFLLPQSWAAEPESSSYSIDCADIDGLIRYFDDENGKALLELWDSIMHGGVGRHVETFKISVYIHIYVALIPFRRNLPNDERITAMQSLRDYFQSRTEDCTTDEEVLKYFALPFIQDPQEHPIFKKLFTESWINEVRSRLQALTIILGHKKQALSPLETDLAQLFLSWSESVQHTVELEHGHSWTLQTTPHPVTLTSSASFNIKSLKDDNPLRTFFENIDELTEENRRLKIKETDSEQKYSQLLNFCAVLVGYLVEACQGKSVDMLQLKNSICEVFPQMVHSNELRTSQETPGRNEMNRNDVNPDAIQKPKGKDAYPRPKVLSNRRNHLSQKTDNYRKKRDGNEPRSQRERARVQNSHRERETVNVEATEAVPSQLLQSKHVQASCFQHENQCGDVTENNEQNRNSCNRKASSATRFSKMSSRTRSRSPISLTPENKPKPFRHETGMTTAARNITITCSENELLDTACNYTSRPRTYELESSTQNFEYESDDAEIPISSSQNGQNQDFIRAPQVQQRQDDDDDLRPPPNQSSSGRRTYRVRVIEATRFSNHKNVSLANNPTESHTPVKTASLHTSCETDRLPNSTGSPKSGQLSKRLPLEFFPVAEDSARGDFSTSPRTDTARGLPTVSTDGNRCMNSNSNASWNSVLHAADSITINAQSVNHESSRRKNEFTRRPQFKRSLSETNLGKKN